MRRLEPFLFHTANACLAPPSGWLSPLRQVVMSRPIIAQPCGLSEYYEPGGTACLPCVVGAVCNGTGTLLTAENWWRRDSRSLAFRECGPRASPCLGGVEVGRCKSGFQGPLCASCVEGHAGDYCQPCVAEAVDFVVLMGLGMMFMCVMGYTIYTALKKGHEHKGNTLMISFKVTLTFYQVCLRGVHKGRDDGALCPILQQNMKHVGLNAGENRERLDYNPPFQGPSFPGSARILSPNHRFLAAAAAKKTI